MILFPEVWGDVYLHAFEAATWARDDSVHRWCPGFSLWHVEVFIFFSFLLAMALSVAFSFIQNV